MFMSWKRYQENIKSYQKMGHELGVLEGKAIALNEAHEKFIHELRALFLDAPYGTASHEIASILVAHEAAQRRPCRGF